MFDVEGNQQYRQTPPQSVVRGPNRQPWPDGKISIEMHLQVYIQDLQTLSVSSQKPADNILLSDVLAGINFLFSSRIHNKIGHLDPVVCQNLLAALLQFTDEIEPGWRIRPVLTKEAEKALEIFYNFLVEIPEFRVS